MSKFIYKDGSFQSIDGKQSIEKLKTKVNVVLDNVDAEFVQQGKYVSSSKDDGFLGTWNYDLEANSNIFYIVSDTDIQEVIIFDQNIPTGKIAYYITNINGYIHNCQPEEGDIIYTTYKEAHLQLLQQSENSEFHSMPTSQQVIDGEDDNENERQNTINQYQTEYSADMENNEIPSDYMTSDWMRATNDILDAAQQRNKYLQAATSQFQF